MWQWVNETRLFDLRILYLRLIKMEIDSKELHRSQPNNQWVNQLVRCPFSKIDFSWTNSVLYSNKHTKFALGLSLSVSHSHTWCFAITVTTKWSTLIHSCQHNTRIQPTMYRSFTWSVHPVEHNYMLCVCVCTNNCNN